MTAPCSRFAIVGSRAIWRAAALLSFLTGLAALAVAAIAQPAAAVPREAPVSSTYYVSSTSGDDEAAGTDASTPWRSLARVNAHRFAPGDRILLRAGEVFAGQLRLSSSGRAGRPITIGRYGAGPKPLIDGSAIAGGGYAAAILIRNQHHIEIGDIEITNAIDRVRRGERRDHSFGILVINDNGGILEHFRLRRLTVRDVFSERLAHGSEDAFNRVVVSAIRFVTEAEGGPGRPSYFRDIEIADNDIMRTGRFGVQIAHGGGKGGSRDAHSRDPETGFNRDIVIRDNRFTDLGGSAVQLAGARMALIHGNDFLRTGSSLLPERMVGRGSGAWVINSRDIVAQHNRSRQVRGYKDSYGMHVDFGNLNILYQYNLSVESEGGFVEILGNNRNIIWRYNISINDGLREKDGNSIWLSPWSPGMVRSQGIHIYHNTIFVRAGLYPDLDFRARDASIWNNIFFAATHAGIGEQLRMDLTEGKPDIAGNLFAGRINQAFRALDRSARTGDPRFLLPGSTDPGAYVPDAASPAVAGGVARQHPSFPAAGTGVLAGVSERPATDFFGTPIPLAQRPTIGAVLAGNR